MKLAQITESLEEIEVPIFRGLKVPPGTQLGDILTQPVRKDRKPSDTTVLSSMLFNYGIQSRFGIPDIRKTSVFAGGGIGVARFYADAKGKGVGQIMLPVDSFVVFNERVYDSMMVLEHRDIKTFARELWDVGADKFGVDEYLAKNSGELFHDAIAEIVTDSEKFIQIMRKFQDLALFITEGYEMMHASAIPGHLANKAIEYIINGIDHFDIKIIELDGGKQYDQKFQRPVKHPTDQGIPF